MVLQNAFTKLTWPVFVQLDVIQFLPSAGSETKLLKSNKKKSDNIYYIIWLSNLLTMLMRGEFYSKNTPCGLHRQGTTRVLHLVLILINITVLLLFVQNDGLLKVLWIFLWI